MSWVSKSILIHSGGKPISNSHTDKLIRRELKAITMTNPSISRFKSQEGQNMLLHFGNRGRNQ